MKPKSGALGQGWLICLAVGLICACLSAALLFVGLNQPGPENGYQFAGMLLSQPAWIGLALAAYLAARKLSREGAGSLGVGGRVFAGLFAVAAILAGGFLLQQGYSNAGIGGAETVEKMKTFGLGAVAAGALGLLYCVFAGRNPDAPDLDLD